MRGHVRRRPDRPTDRPTCQIATQPGSLPFVRSSFAFTSLVVFLDYSAVNVMGDCVICVIEVRSKIVSSGGGGGSGSNGSGGGSSSSGGGGSSSGSWDRRCCISNFELRGSSKS